MARGSGGTSLMGLLAVGGLIGVIVFTGIGQDVLTGTTTIVRTVTHTITNTVFGTNGSTDPAHQTSRNGTWTIKIEAENGGFGCLIASDPINITFDSILINTTLSQWSGSGSKRTYADSRFVLPIGSVMVLQLDIDNATVSKNSLNAFLLSYNGQEMKIKMTLC